MYLTILILPLLGSFISGFMGRKIGVYGAYFITCTCLFISSILASIAFYEVGLAGSPVTINLASWIDLGNLTVSWEFNFDQLTVTMLIPVLFISFLIHVYSISYMAEDPAICFGKTILWGKLSNSGEALKLMVPSYSRKAISGWTNYSGMVISHKMNENEMGYRGSKSDFLNKSVKEQRVDGSWLLDKKASNLRCTLMGFERNYQIKIPSKQLNIKNFSTLNYSSSLPCSAGSVNPWFWTGLTDAEGSFSILISKDNKRTLGWRVESKFQMDLHIRDLSLLLQFQQFLGGIGYINKYPARNMVYYSISSNKELNKLITHFENYPLLTQKAADFLLFKEAVILMNNKAHLTIEGLKK